MRALRLGEGTNVNWRGRVGARDVGEGERELGDQRTGAVRPPRVKSEALSWPVRLPAREWWLFPLRLLLSGPRRGDVTVPGFPTRLDQAPFCYALQRCKSVNRELAALQEVTGKKLSALKPSSWTKVTYD